MAEPHVFMTNRFMPEINALEHSEKVEDLNGCKFSACCCW
jgi:hypothetical protein